MDVQVSNLKTTPGRARPAAAEREDRRGPRSSPVSRARATVARYFQALNTLDLETLSEIVSPELIHDLDSVERRLGREAFLAYLAARAREYREHVFDIQVMVNAEGTRAAAEFTLLGFPLAEGPEEEIGDPQTYRISGGLFFQLDQGCILRVSQHAPPPRTRAL